MVFRILFLGLAIFFFYWGTARAGTLSTGASFRTRYPLATASDKLVDNEGKGFLDLYGVRNFRAVLNGVYYRGGANNIFFEPRRENSNPLPTAGLRNLCEEGFTRSVYLYSTRYESAPRTLRCKTKNGNENTIEYLQISPLHFRVDDLKALLTMIHQHAREPRRGPIYDHCWNGWHASGFVAATTLRQFCGFTGDQAVAYWNMGTDGNNKGSHYDQIRSRIRAFKPFPELLLSPAEKLALCPQPGTFAFRGPGKKTN